MRFKPAMKDTAILSLKDKPIVDTLALLKAHALEDSYSIRRHSVKPNSFFS